MKISSPKANTPQWIAPPPPKKSEDGEPVDQPLDGVIISVNDEPVAVLKQAGPGLASRILTGAGEVLGTTARGVIGVANADPSFALAQIARGVKPLVLEQMPREAGEKLDQIYPGVLKGVSLALNAKKWLDRRQRSELAKMDGSYNNFDRVGELFDTAHLATDVIGIAGAITHAFAPASVWASGLMGASVAADVAVASFHAIEFISEGPPGEPPQQPPQDPPQDPPSAS